MEPTFLTVLTRHMAGREKLLRKNQESLLLQTDPDYEQIIIHDHFGLGIDVPNLLLPKVQKLLEIRGRYVLILDDDDTLSKPEAIEILKREESGEDLILFGADHGAHGILPSDKCRKADRPLYGEIGSCDFILRRELWLEHSKVFGPEYMSDFVFLDSIWQSSPTRKWLPDVLAKIQQRGGDQSNEDTCLLSNIPLRAGDCPLYSVYKAA